MPPMPPMPPPMPPGTIIMAPASASAATSASSTASRLVLDRRQAASLADVVAPVRREEARDATRAEIAVAEAAALGVDLRVGEQVLPTPCRSQMQICPPDSGER